MVLYYSIRNILLHERLLGHVWGLVPYSPSINRGIPEESAQRVHGKTPILVIFCTYYVSGSHIPCTKYEHSRIILCVWYSKYESKSTCNLLRLSKV